MAKKRSDTYYRNQRRKDKHNQKNLALAKHLGMSTTEFDENSTAVDIVGRYEDDQNFGKPFEESRLNEGERTNEDKNRISEHQYKAKQQGIEIQPIKETGGHLGNSDTTELLISKSSKSLSESEEPKAVPLPIGNEPLYHITSIENFQSIVSRGGLVPLNWIIEGTNGQVADTKAANLGLDAARGEGEYETLESYGKEVEEAKNSWVSEKGKELERYVAEQYADIKLGRKRDFIYGTQKGDTLASYRDTYKDNGTPSDRLVLLRWVQNGESYYPDLQDGGAIKSLTSIPLARLQVAFATNLGDASKEELERLTWISANNSEALTKNGLLV